jgi:hypothetical protein
MSVESEVALTSLQWLQIIALGGLVGASGQGARVIVGLKKKGQEAEAEGKELKDEIVASQLIISLAIGFVAGALAAALAGLDPLQVSLKEILALAAAGYAGADFVEGALSSFVPQNKAASAPAAPAPQIPLKDEHLG